MLRYLQGRDPSAVLIDGPRGTGKSTLCDALVQSTNMRLYKTWGVNQRDEKKRLEPLGLNLPQGGFFALDLLCQVKLAYPIVIDRSFLSSMVFQKWDGDEITLYYLDLLKRSKSILLVLLTQPKILLERRLSRGHDEFLTPSHEENEMLRMVTSEVSDYGGALAKVTRLLNRDRSSYMQFDLGHTRVFAIDQN